MALGLHGKTERVLLAKSKFLRVTSCTGIEGTGTVNGLCGSIRAGCGRIQRSWVLATRRLECTRNFCFCSNREDFIDATATLTWGFLRRGVVLLGRGLDRPRLVVRWAILRALVPANGGFLDQRLGLLRLLARGLDRLRCPWRRKSSTNTWTRTRAHFCEEIPFLHSR